MADNVQMVNDASKTLGYCTTQLKEQNSVISAEVTFRLAIDISLRRQGTWRNSPKREFRALKRTIEMPFHFRQTRSDCSCPSKEYWELDSCEQVAKDLHDMLYSSLNKTNTEELLDVR